MGLILLLGLSLLLTTAIASDGEVTNPQSSCSSKSSTGDFPSSVHLTLHHPRDPCSPAPFPPLPFSTILHHDDHRAHSLAHRASGHSSSSSSVSAPLTPGTSVGVGNYVTRIGLGTPSKTYIVVVDTGSSLSWLQCSPCNVSCHDQVGPVFDPSSSTSYRPVPCSASECSSLPSATLNPSGCSESKVCVYEASYGDSSFSVGYLSRDTLSIASLSVPGFVYGCGQDNEGLFGQSAGLIGLAKNKLSLLSQVAPKVGSLAFSYCLPTTSSTGFVSFGPYAASKFSYTPMVSNSLDDTLYFVKLAAITVAGKSLPVSSSSYSGTPTIIDSGTVITRLPSDVYSALADALSASLSKYKKAPAYSILDTCFVGSVRGLAVPEVSLVFAGGATMRLPPRNVFIDVDGDTTCVAFAPSGRVAIVGNRQQQTFNMVYDVEKARIGFAAGGCG
ncbi:putative protein ASPARTIC PROTEASE IN GUARD CELL 1 [Iris pallida]|uniref:Peptidase A1 domain-containing protein n=1 Tax=Iris pallida TaxID=29817 RepID=A0AAX6I447_IRIPA|nr:putative protein ASPARTIC PROTEASE IN GUARD CELL 1 [Iris pallida]